MKKLLKILILIELILTIFEMNETSAISINKINNMILNEPLHDYALLKMALKWFNQNKNNLKTESELKRKFFKEFSKSQSFNLNHLNEAYSMILHSSKRLQSLNVKQKQNQKNQNQKTKQRISSYINA
jgi:hypothetical protein